MLMGVPDLAFALVDVRDIAEAHVKAAEVDSAHGRYIVAGSGMTSFLEISKLLKSAHATSWYLPTWNIPNWVLYLLGPLTGLTRRWLNANIGIKFSLDNSRSINELGIKYRVASQSLVDHYYSWVISRER
jgi:nucleoside-diphosphate-sugar epimerase